MGTVRVPGEADPPAMELQQMRKLYLLFSQHNLNQISFDLFWIGVMSKPEPL